MKKKLLITAAASLALCSANAQLAMTNFNSGVPSTWSMFKVDNNIPNSTFVSSVVSGLTSKAWMTWIRNSSTGDSSLLTTSYFTTAGTADRWVVSPQFTVTTANMIITWEDYAGDATVVDKMQVWVSPTGAATSPASFTTKIYDQDASITGFAKHGVDLSAYVGQSIRVGFRDNSTNKYVMFLDNIGTEIPANALDASMEDVSVKLILDASTTTTPVTVEVKNKGAKTITSLELNYKLDNGTPVTQTFTGLSLYPYNSTALTFNTPFNKPATGSAHTITATVAKVNGAADPVTTNNSATTNFGVSSKDVTRAGLYEEFTSNTCVPCAGYNAVFDPYMVNTVKVNTPAANVNIIKYQMNWPSPFTDFFYNQDGNARRNYYGVNSIPDHFVNGEEGIASTNTTTIQSEVDASKAKASAFDIDGSYVVDGDSLLVWIKVTPHVTLTSTNIKLQAAATQMYYQVSSAKPYGRSTTQTDFYHVERVMFPSASGTAVANWNDGTAQNFTFKTKYTIGVTGQNQSTFESNPISSSLVIFLQDDNTKEVLQSKVINAAWPTSVKELNSNILVSGLYPNPAQESTTLEFALNKSEKLSIVVLDAMGKVVTDLGATEYTSGVHTVKINTSNLASGFYNVRVTGENTVQTLKLTK